jgi:hypothetical protein
MIFSIKKNLLKLYCVLRDKKGNSLLSFLSECFLSDVIIITIESRDISKIEYSDDSFNSYFEAIKTGVKWQKILFFG